MGIGSEEAIRQLISLMDQADEPLKKTFENVHQGYPAETMVRFLKARDWDVTNAHNMLVESMKWRLQNEIDIVLKKPIVPMELFRAVRDSQLIGVSGRTREGHPVFAIGVGLSTFDKASVNHYVQSHIQINEYRDRIILPSATQEYGRHINSCVKVLDMTGLKLSALANIKLLTVISTIDDLNYPEKTKTYYIVNAPYVFSTCWKVVKPLLQERTRKKVQVLSGCGKEELLKVMDYDSLPHFCKKEGSSGGFTEASENCYSPDHSFHRQLYGYITEQSSLTKQGSFHVCLPETEAEENEIARTIESQLHVFEDHPSDDDALNG